MLSVAQKFLDDTELGSDAIRAAVSEFMPYSFALVNGESRRLLQVGHGVESRTSHTSWLFWVGVFGGHTLLERLLLDNAESFVDQSGICALIRHITKLSTSQSDLCFSLNPASLHYPVTMAL